MENETDPLAHFGWDAIDLRWTLKGHCRQTKLDNQQAAFGTAS
jgi:hypothetical protein